jgi:ABC-type glycerol-3-phosphate transport system substrate-binding protein
MTVFSYPIKPSRILLLLGVGLMLVAFANATRLVYSRQAVMATPTPESSEPLTIWWPDTLGPVGNQESSDLLNEQLDAFQRTQSNLRINLRLKKTEGVGGIMETLSAAQAVAPSALPDVTLLRYADLVSAAQSDLIQAVADRIDPSIISDLYPTALKLGQVGNLLYGIPYVFEIEHMAYRPIILSGNFARFSDVLDNRQSFVFPASASSNQNAVLLLQYLSAGGDLTELNQGKLNADALQNVLKFYEQAVTDGIVDVSVLDYASTNDYQTKLIEGQIGAAVVTSTQYLELLKQDTSFEPAPIPQADGEPLTMLDGWVWVLVSHDVQRQNEALRLIEWMMDSDRQAAYAQLVDELPSRQSLMQSGEYTTFVERLLPQALFPLTNQAPENVLQVMQDALTAVLTKQRTAEVATQDALTQISGTS